ncbi:hypothetical protein FisN_23Lh070 [Fistulifera solaris]|uniref:Uncharacterized protein n=1 Tax=Fistulifera solaris TaxID=1519565 RepID=A0A1Z5KJQ2_FISSO|nr:hypothetical protein FisN_23Lh070 [Fistulifera solaris]|eukprot:GAX26544.1 hypothetical protein FisN_23Lh070 [Fistulifera solaris]
MTGNQTEPLTSARQQAQRTSLRRYVVEKWGAHDDIDDSDAEESENESVTGHFRAALSNAASKLRFPLRQKDRTPDLDSSANSDDEVDDGKSLISALSKTAANITTTLLKKTTLIKTVTHRAHTEQPSDDSNMGDLIGKEISSNYPHDHCYDDSSTSSLGSVHDPIDDISKEDIPDKEIVVSCHQHSPEHKRPTYKAKAAGSGCHTGRSKRPTRLKSDNYDLRGEADHRKIGNRADHGVATNDPSPKAGRRRAPTERGARRTKSHNDDTKHRKHRDDHHEYRVVRPKEVASHTEPCSKERQRSVHRPSSLPRKHKECEPKGRSPTTTPMTCSRSGFIEKNQRGIQRAKSHDLAHMHKRAERRTNLVNPSPFL